METRDGVLILGLCDIYTDATIDVKPRDFDTDTHRFESMEKLLAWQDKNNKYKYGKRLHEKRIFPCLLFLLWIWVNSWQRKWMNPFCTCVAGLTFGSQLRLRVHTQKWYEEIYSPVPCGTGIRNGSLNCASGWRNKPCAIIILRANPQTIFLHPCDTPPPPPLPTPFQPDMAALTSAVHTHTQAYVLANI